MDDNFYMNYYDSNEKFRQYVNKFARDNEILPAQAITYQACISYAKYLMEKDNVRAERT